MSLYWTAWGIYKNYNNYVVILVSYLEHKEEVVIDHKATGEAMRKHRTDADLSIRQVAKVYGVSAPYISDLENGNRNWTEERAAQYMEAIKYAIRNDTT